MFVSKSLSEPMLVIGHFFIQESAFENVVCKSLAILSQPQCVSYWTISRVIRAGLILSLCSANERRRYKLTPSLIGWAQT